MHWLALEGSPGLSDLRTSRVPNAIVYPSMLLALLVATFMPASDLLSSLAGGGLGAGFLLAVSVLSKGSLGMGDVKLAAFAGLALGLRFVVPALLITAVLSAPVAAALLASGAKRQGDAIPYAPFIATGALAVLFWRGAVFVSLLGKRRWEIERVGAKGGSRRGRREAVGSSRQLQKQT